MTGVTGCGQPRFRAKRHDGDGKLVGAGADDLDGERGVRRRREQRERDQNDDSAEKAVRPV